MNEELETDTDLGGSLARIGADVQCRLAGRVRDFQVVLSERGVILRGRAHSHYAKQLAQQAVMDVVALPISANEIQVLRNA
jgi:hypothetical protein